MSRICRGVASAATALLLARSAAAQHGRVIVDTVKSASLANLVGDPTARQVTIYLPPSYATSANRRYPVVYLLHGFTGTDEAWAPARYNVPGLMDSLIAGHASAELIVVMPNAFTAFGGSFYVNSSTNGNWEDFIARDLVAYVDQHFRTLAHPTSRGIAGHSMGGYGAFYLGMRHAGTVFGAIYGLSACCSRAGVGADALVRPERWDSINSLRSLDALSRAPFFTKAYAALAAAYSPDPGRPPFYFDPEVVRHNGTPEVDRAVQAKWEAHSTLLMVPRYAAALKSLRGIAFDIGDHDQAVRPAEMFAMDSAMTRSGVAHTFETYDGDHLAKIGDRLAMRVMPFFSRVLVTH